MAGVVKRSLSFPVELFEAVEQEARTDGVAVSAIVAEAAGQWLLRRRGLRSVRAWEAEHGTFTELELAEADALLDGRADSMP